VKRNKGALRLDFRPAPDAPVPRLVDELFPSVNYLTLPDRFLNDAGERGRMGSPSGKSISDQHGLKPADREIEISILACNQYRIFTMANFCQSGKPSLVVDTAYVPASNGFSSAFIWLGDPTMKPLEMLSTDGNRRITAKEDTDTADLPYRLPASGILTYGLVSEDIGFTYFGVIKGTSQKYTGPLRVLPSLASRIDFMNKGRLFIIGNRSDLCKRAEQLISQWIWYSYVGRAVLEEIFESRHQVFVQIGQFTEDPSTRSLSIDDSQKPGTGSGGTGLGADALSRFNENITMTTSSCDSACVSRGLSRPEFALMHELTHASRIVRAKVTLEAGGPTFGKLEEEVVTLISNMQNSEKGGPVRVAISTETMIGYNPKTYFTRIGNAARRSLIVLMTDHPKVFAAANSATVPIPFNPVYAWFKGGTTIPDYYPGSDPSPDTGSRDAGSPDVRPPDAASRDAGSPDARPPDTASPDAGSPDERSPRDASAVAGAP
jgi:hypothetical protein